jgi:anti-anti-sigma factor
MSVFISSRRAETGGSIRVILAGELDLAERRHLESDLEMAQNDSHRVLIDLRALSFIDCACTATLFASARRARGEGAVLIFLGPLGQVRRLLDLVGPPPGVAVLERSDLHEPRPPVAA